MKLQQFMTRNRPVEVTRPTSTLINSIIDWSDDDVWEFLTFYGCKSNPLYQCGRKRIGCISCPMQNSKGMIRDFAKYPKYKNNYIRAFDQMLKRIAEHSTWKTGIDVYKWWVGIDLNQLTLIDIV